MLSATLPRLRTLGFELDPSPDHFGFLRDTQPGADDLATLQARLADDGYLFLRDFWSREGSTLPVRRVPAVVAGLWRARQGPESLDSARNLQSCNE